MEEFSRYKGPKVNDRHGIRDIFLAIAELNGYKVGTIKGKIKFGVQCWFESKLHDLDLLERQILEVTEEDYERVKDFLPAELKENYSVKHKEFLREYKEAEKLRVESERTEVYENIWLERIYEGLDKHFNIQFQTIKQKALTSKEARNFIFSRHKDATYEWDIPIELDATASLLQMYGILLNDVRLMLLTNVVVQKGKLNDAWTIPGLSRLMVKTAATPRLYGSSREEYELWRGKKINYTPEQVKIFKEEINSGALGVADAFKDFLVNNCKPTEVMKLKIGEDEFEVECNRYRQVGDITKLYDLYDSGTKSVHRIAHTHTKKVPDLEQFRRYFPTGLVHNLDSQTADYVSGKAMLKYGWEIEIYDAFIVHPMMARDIRKWYGEYLTYIYTNRNKILQGYFESIGIGAEAQAKWEKVKSMVVPCTEFKPSPMALK